MRIILFTSLCAMISIGAYAQGSEDVHHNNISVGGGAAIPAGNATNYLNTAPAFLVSYGYRFNRWFQADAGLQMAFGAASNQNAEQTDYGTVQGGDHEFMIPLGGRIFVPVPLHKLEASVGGGAAYLHYSETASSGGYGYSSNCYTCTSRGGWGGYGLVNVSYFLDENRNFHIGTTLQYIAGSTNGSPVANIPAAKTSDHWVNAFLEFGISF